MLQRLSVENYALIASLELHLSPHLNIITGETGAGKSILLGALGLVLGNRADTTALKENNHNCIVEATFNIEGYGLEAFFEENDIEYEPETTIRRIISPQGKSRAYINDIPVQLVTLKELSSFLIDIHSQHQSLLVASPHFRTSIIDSVADNRSLRDKYTTIYTTLRETERELAVLRENSAAAKRDGDYIRHQWEQISALKLRAGEETELEQQQSLLGNAETIVETLGMTSEALDGDEGGVITTLKSAENELRHIEGVYPKSTLWTQRVRSVIEELKDLNGDIESEREGIDANPEKLEAIDSRLAAIYELFRKHGATTTEQLLAMAEEFENRLLLISNSDEQIARLEVETENLQKKATTIAAQITQTRQEASAQLSTQVESIIARLGMPASRFVCRILPLANLSPSGGDNVEFLFTANGDTTAQGLEKIASGGETSRVMLALKSIVARGTKLPTIIFDEIDTGVSGRIADATGAIIAELGDTMQVINITHLPQVASKGDTHFVVYKSEGRTQIKLLSHEQRVEEIAKMLSGNRITDAAIAQAHELLRNS